MNIDHYMQSAELAAQASDDNETKVGCVLVEPRGLLELTSTANTFINSELDLPRTRPGKYEFMIHAEINLVLRAAKMGFSTDNSIVFVTLSPCANCLRVLYKAGIKEIYFKDFHYSFTHEMRDLPLIVTKTGQYHKIVLR